MNDDLERLKKINREILSHRPFSLTKDWVFEDFKAFSDYCGKSYRDSIKDKILNLHPINFIEDTHQYFVNGEEYTSVSKVLETLTPKFDAKKMSKKCSENPNHEYFGKSPQEILDIWEDKNKNACDLGTEFHNIVQLFLEDKDISFSVFNQDLFMQFREFHFEYFIKHKIEIIGLELKIASPTFKICGTFDALLIYKGELFIFDWKTNSKFDTDSEYKMNRPYSNYDKSKLTYYTFQLYIYRWILEVEYGIKISDCRIVWFSENEYKIHKPKFEYKENFIKKLLKNYRK